MASEVIAELKSLIEQTTDCAVSASSISDDANLVTDCGLDSILIVDFTVVVERHFDITFPIGAYDQELPPTVAELAQLVERCIASKS